MIHPTISQHIPAIRDLCRDFGVEKLEIFGSAVTDAFDPNRSDVDFIVTYPDGYDFGPFGKRLQNLEAELARLLHRDVDLIIDAPFRNPVFADAVRRTRREVYREREAA